MSVTVLLSTSGQSRLELDQTASCLESSSSTAFNIIVDWVEAVLGVDATAPLKCCWCCVWGTGELRKPGLTALSWKCKCHLRPLLNLWYSMWDPVLRCYYCSIPQSQCNGFTPWWSPILNDLILSHREKSACYSGSCKVEEDDRL